jgi:pyridoxamine 5'-phosphate oxidase
MELAELRKEYTKGGLKERDLRPNPFEQFQLWLDQAIAAELKEPNAMCLATADADGSPSARMVLLKGVDERGFTFYTNYESRKAEELEENPRAALVFYWSELERQVRITGSVEKVTREETEAYFAMRPRESQLGAWVSEQSAVISGRKALEERKTALEKWYEGMEIPAPPNWGGYRVKPDEIEFWQGRPGRLHDRLRYGWEDGKWIVERLAP